MYHHGNLREAALDEAVVMLETVGADALTLRSLAERLGVTHRALYRHFDDRTSLLSEAAVRTIQALQATMSAAADKARATKRDKLIAVTDAYLGFALAKPEAYRHALHAGFATSSASSDLHAAGRALGTFFSSLFAPGEIIRDDAIALWGMLHGLIDLYLGGSLRAGSRELAHRYILERVTAAI